MIVSQIRGLLFFAFMNICESEIVAANRGPENPKKGAHRPGSAPVKRRLKVKFKLTIQSENLRFNSKCFYHLKANQKW